MKLQQNGMGVTQIKRRAAFQHVMQASYTFDAFLLRERRVCVAPRNVATHSRLPSGRSTRSILSTLFFNAIAFELLRARRAAFGCCCLNSYLVPSLASTFHGS